MKMFYICNTEDWSDRWEPEYYTWEHVIYAHDEEAAKELFCRKHYGYMAGKWDIEHIGDAPSRKRQGFAGPKAEHEILWQRFLAQQHKTEGESSAS